MAEDVEVGNRTSSTIKSTKNLSASVDIAEDTKIGESDDGNNKTVKKSPSKKLSKPIKYFIFLHSEKKITT